MKDLDRNIRRSLISFYSHNTGSGNHFTLYVDPKTKTIYKAGAGTSILSSPKYILLFIIIFIIMNYFPNNIIPYHHTFILFSLSLIVMILSILLGNSLSLRLVKDIKRITLSKEEWKCYLTEGNKFYTKQVMLTVFLFIFSCICFVLLFLSQSKWWLFGGIGSSIALGPLIPLLSKSRYLLFKNKLPVKLDSDEE